jgi:hypothetical protein
MENLTDEQFYERYTPQINHILWDKYKDVYEGTPTSQEDITSFNGCMYETFGEEVDYVISMAVKGRVATIVDEDGGMFIYSGFWRFNRMGYLVLDKEITEEFIVKLD